jgi:hypothetical protein
MRTALSLMFAAVLSLAGPLPHAARAADWPKPEASYSATRVMASGGMSLSGPLYHDHGKERWERAAKGMQQVMILRPDLQKAFMVMPQMNMAIEMGLADAPSVPSPEKYAQGAPVAVGQATIDGETTTEYRSEGQTARGPFVMRFWVTADGIVMKMQGESPEGIFESRLENLRRGPQDPALFELPPGVQAMPVNPAMMRQMAPGAAQ